MYKPWKSRHLEGEQNNLILRGRKLTMVINHWHPLGWSSKLLSMSRWSGSACWRRKSKLFNDPMKWKLPRKQTIFFWAGCFCSDIFLSYVTTLSWRVKKRKQVNKHCAETENLKVASTNLGSGFFSGEPLKLAKKKCISPIQKTAEVIWSFQDSENEVRLSFQWRCSFLTVCHVRNTF